MWTVLLYATCAVHISLAQVPWFLDSYEGSACKTPMGAPGVCKERDDCLVTLPNPVPVSEDANGRALCGSVGPNALVCCGSRPAADDVTGTTTTTSTSPSVVTTTAPLVTRTEPPRTPVGYKSAEYCLSIISFNKQPWWIDEGSTRENNEISKWWEEKEQDTPPKQIYWPHDDVQTYHKEYPHMALLGYRLPGQTDIKWSCAGSLISDRFVLTAAHCHTEDNLKPLNVVRLGEYDLSADDRTEQDFDIEKIWPHPKEGPGINLYHDIALVKLNRNVKFTHAISPACLYSSPEGQERQDGLVISGWGISTNDILRVLWDRPRQDVLKGSAPLRVVPRNECAKYYRQATHQVPNGIHPGMVCAVDRTRYLATCPGDRGGPIQLKTSFDVYVIVGVTTEAASHCGDGTPNLYTRVAYYIDWIENIVWPNGVE